MRLIAVLLAVTIAAGVTQADQPQLTGACAAYSAALPGVRNALSSGLARHAEVGVITAAQAVIEPICANPSSTDSSAVASVTGSTSQIADAVANIKARQASGVPVRVAAHH